MSEPSGVSALVITTSDDDVAAIDRSLRDNGHAAHCYRVDKLNALEAAITKREPEIILLCSDQQEVDLPHAIKTRDRLDPNLPVLLVSNEIDETTICSAMRIGARDVVSLSNPERLGYVSGRELRSYRLENALESVMGSARQYKQELNSLKQVSLEAIADIQEGIIVNANPAWLDLFGLKKDDDMTGLPIMDMCADTDRPALKGALVACHKGKWTDTILEIKAVSTTGEEFALALNLENIEHDGEPAVRILITPEKPEEETPHIVIEQALQRDQITGFFSRNHFLGTLKQRLKTQPSGGVRAVAYVRPDKFSKAIDDIGLIGTENIIKQVAQLIKGFVQPSDIYGRFGGTMFTIMLERGTMADVEAWAGQLLKAFNDAVFDHKDHSTVITCSIGICEVDSDKLTVSKLLTDAERACKDGRTAGGNRVELSESSGAAKKIRQDDTIWVPKIRGALMENRSRLEHQPIGSLNSDIEDAYDTLVRMLDEEGNTILPSEFMSVAERKGLSKNIDRWVIGSTLSFCSSNNINLVFIRLSRDSLLDDSLCKWLKEQVKQAKVSPAKICIEVPEEVVAKHLSQAQKVAKSLRTEGFKFAVEHFGKIEDSSRIITHIPMDFVKIDGSLMQGLHKDIDVQNQVKELARMAKDNNIKTVAERVQDANTMAVLWQLGISYIQGNYLQNQEIVIEDTSQSSVTTKALNVEAEAKAPA